VTSSSLSAVEFACRVIDNNVENDESSPTTSFIVSERSQRDEHKCRARFVERHDRALRHAIEMCTLVSVSSRGARPFPVAMGGFARRTSSFISAP
jgi:hypothetical protein